MVIWIIYPYVLLVLSVYQSVSFPLAAKGIRQMVPLVINIGDTAAISTCDRKF